MEKEDARKQSREVLHERRKQVIRLYRKGMRVMQIVEQSGLSWYAVNTAINCYRTAGTAALKPAARGKKAGGGRMLSEAQERTIQKMICDKRPEQLKMEFTLWNRAAVMQLIERKYGIKLTVRGVGNYLKRWGFTPQKPIRRAYERSSEAVQAWLDKIYPEIEHRAKLEGAEIHWGDETAVVNTDVRGRCYAPTGKIPVTFAVGGTRHKLSMIATATNQGKTRWMIIDEGFNADKLIEFLDALIKDTGRKVFLILDNLRVHHSKPVKTWVEEHKEKIELFYLPSYSPELNPEERLNADLKQALYTKVPVRTKTKLRAATTEHMQVLEESPERAKKFFQDERVRYAA
ncbi:isxo7 transposase [Nitrosomonas sp. Is79A3]|uniref:IS630 family transposase n=1 Tax=Nitrosomonas sp. (strain Is79A3) TaxID=261292 RepID=UPI000215CD1D